MLHANCQSCSLLLLAAEGIIHPALSWPITTTPTAVPLPSPHMLEQQQQRCRGHARDALRRR
jgi:hypothetical protein